ncbi:MAG: hypothetical protein KID00_13820 [Clostridium argentinense]|uniref:YokE-like PH domain-containing protein n=2 Tax=Clostridium faecium TaxID=2762223 RepID=A0ABR8YSR0_9CLOT|nr:hypothetical protein [Clostridium butanoliproducens]MBD8047293.1 hypothetical protein [Clostridium faecium]MBS5824902.1 hypothetical protein [Clostridium argentinense]MDU1349128.1 hypothetical protein [Clostridium argentinense]
MLAKYNEIMKCLKKSIGDISTINNYYIENIPVKKLNNSINSYGEGIKKENVLALVDTTILGSGKEGFLFTTEGIYFKESFNEANYISFKDIDFISIIDNDKDCNSILHIMMKNKKIITITSTILNKTPLKKFLQQVIEILKV